MKMHTVHSSVFNCLEGSVGMINKTYSRSLLVGFENVFTFTIMHKNIQSLTIWKHELRI